MRRSWSTEVLVLVGALWAVGVSAGPEARVPVFVRDGWTGLAVPGTSLRLSSGGGTAELRADARAKARLPLPATKGLLDVSAPGYGPLRVDMAPDSTLPLTIWLDPVQRGAPPAANEGEMVLEGRVVDVSTGRPVAGARVQAGEGEVFSGKDGAFTLSLPATAVADPYAPRPTVALTADAPGFATLTLDSIVLEPGVARHLIVDLLPGEGARKVELPHRLLEPEKPSKGTHAPWADPPSVENVFVPGVFAADGIKVGTSCSCTSCSGVSAMSLETYVERGLDNEWFSSWDSPAGSSGRHALRAGAVAYRSYGAWYVNNPINGSYHICSSTCCQAYDSTSSTQSRTAARFTHSTVLSKDGLSIFRSEYSSENNSLWGGGCVNNDLSCGAGKAGSPATGWSCLADHPNCTSRPCFGHGRGMCQFGSNFWANNGGKDFLWILDHYYNANFNPSGNRSVYVEELTGFDVALNADGRMDVFGRWSSDNALKHAAQNSAGHTTFSSWSGVNSGLLLSSPAVAANSDGRLQVVLRGTTHAVWTASQLSPNGSWSGWTQLSGILASSEPVLVRNSNGRLQAFVRDTNYQLYTAVQGTAGGAFGSWVSLGGTCTSGPAAAVNQDGRVQVFARGVDDKLYTRWQTTAGGSTWAGWYGMGAGMIGSKPAVARNSNGRLEVFVRGVEESGPSVWRVRQNAASGVNNWGAWISMNDATTSAPAVVANSDGRLQVFSRGLSGDLRTAAQTSPSGGFGAFTSLGGTCTSAPVAARNSDGRVQVFVRGLDRTLYSRVQSSAGGGFSATWYSLGGSF